MEWFVKNLSQEPKSSIYKIKGLTITIKIQGPNVTIKILGFTIFFYRKGLFSY